MEKGDIHEIKPSHQGTLVMFINNNVILKIFLTEVSWLHLTTPACVCTKKLVQHRKIPNGWLTLEEVFQSFTLLLFFPIFRKQMHGTDLQTRPVHTDTHRWEKSDLDGVCEKGKVHRVGYKVENDMMAWENNLGNN